MIGIYNKYPKNTVRECLYQQILSASKNHVKVIHHFIRLYAGLLAAAQHESDMNVISYSVENVVFAYEKEVKQAIDEHDNNVPFLLYYQ